MPRDDLPARAVVDTAGDGSIEDGDTSRILLATLEAEKQRMAGYLASAVDAVQEAFALCDEHDQVVMMNRTARALLGRELGGGVAGLPFEAMIRTAIGEGAFDTVNETRDALLARWLVYHREPAGALEVRMRDGRYLRVVDRPTAEHGTVTTIADVTDDVHREDELRTARAAAEAASAAKSEFLSSMSHELRTPLNAVLGFAQLLERDRKHPLEPRQLERVQHVLRGGEHLLRLIDDVLDLATIEAGHVTIAVEPVAIVDVIREVIATLEPLATRAQIRIAPAVLAPGRSLVRADRMRLAQILMNFGSNAIKYGRAGGHFAFQCRSDGGTVRVSVRDDGIGIPAAKLQLIFAPFQRAGQESGPIQGTGIGLAISKRLVELMGGHIGFTSRQDLGSTFWIELPTSPLQI